ncbi:MAG: TolC family protein [Gammaproteobacteria bacterium]
MTALRRLLIAGALLAGAAAARAELTLDAVLASSLEHFPAIQSAVQETLIREGRVTGALGAFDLALEQDAKLRSGYYDGRTLDSRVVKPLPLANARAFAGYRLSNDDFPVYEDEYVTTDGGEFNLGVVLSLWRDRAIDSRRFELAAARLGVREAELDLLLARITTQRNATRAYWSWVIAGKRLQVYEELVALAEQRMRAFEQRAAAGDIAEIFIVENRQNLLRRQALATDARREFAARAIELSLYLRDAEGGPLLPAPGTLPRELPSAKTAIADTDALAAEVLAIRPELARLDNRLAIERKRLALAENELMPRVDLGLKGAHDVGAGPRSRQGFEAVVDLTVSIPLETRRGRGRVAESRARMNQIELDRLLLEQRLTNEVRKLGTNINAIREFVALTAEEAVQAETMEEAERKRFTAGASDFFLVNLREERSADAEIRNLDARLRYLHGVADLNAITIDRTALGL